MQYDRPNKLLAIELIKRYGEAVAESVKAPLTRKSPAVSYAREMRQGAILASYLCGDHTTMEQFELGDGKPYIS